MMVFQQGRRNLEQFEDEFWSGADLTKLYHRGTEVLNSGKEIDGVENVFRAGFKEFSRLSQQGNADPDAVMEGTQRLMRVALSREEDKLERHLSFLATVGSTSPYIGLFGTVWGIMNSFRSLSTLKQVTIATVAPGISEALVATTPMALRSIPLARRI